MIPYIEYMMIEFSKHGETINTSSSRESDHLFKTREDTIFLEETQAKIITIVFKAMFATKRSRPDIYTTV